MLQSSTKSRRGSNQWSFAALKSESNSRLESCRASQLARLGRVTATNSPHWILKSTGPKLV